MAGVVVCQAVHCAARETVHHLTTQGDGEGYKIEDDVPPALWGINWRGLNVKCAMRGGQLERVKLDAGKCHEESAEVTTHPDFSENKDAPC